LTLKITAAAGIIRDSIFCGILAILFCAGPLISPAQSAPVTGPINEVSVFGNGSTSSNSPVANIQQTVNGIPTAIVGDYLANEVVFHGNPSTITVNVQVRDFIVFVTTNITFTVTTATGAVTVNGSASGTGITGPLLTLTADGTTTTAPFTAGGAINISGTGDPSDRQLNYCVEMGNSFCVRIFLKDTTMPAPGAAPASAAAQTAALDNESQNGIVKGIKLMTEHVSSVMMQQMSMIGMLLDAKHQMESERLFGQMQAETHRDFQVSEQICAFGTLARSTASSKFKVDANILAINSLMQKRELLSGYSAASWGPFSDMTSRIQQYKAVYCDPNDDNKEIGSFCASGTSARKNNDIDYVRTISGPMTLDVDFTDGVRTNAEEDIIALSRNLFDHKVLTAIPEKTMWSGSGGIYKLQDMRMLSAVRSVARNSFASIVAAKTPGSGMSSAQLRNVMAGIGVPAGDIDSLIGTNPSYFAQMDIISQKMFQDPEFITNLYVGPANVARTGVALQAIQIMKDRDRLEAALRKEMLLSMILEMKLREAQQNVFNKQSVALGRGRR
jgi:hypothetical protein